MRLRLRERVGVKVGQLREGMLLNGHAELILHALEAVGVHERVAHVGVRVGERVVGLGGVGGESGGGHERLGGEGGGGSLVWGGRRRRLLSGRLR